MMQLILKYSKYFIFFLFMVFLTPSCDKINDSPIPDVHVFFTVNIILVNQLNVSGNSVYFPGYGYGGVIVYCEIPGSYLAFDASCTKEASHSCIAENESIMGKCICCGSEFLFPNGGYPSKGPASIPLKQYHVSMVNDFTLQIYN